MPREIPPFDLEIINLSIEELEAIHLCDLLNVDQNEAGDVMAISIKISEMACRRPGKDTYIKLPVKEPVGPTMLLFSFSLNNFPLL